MLKIGGIQPFSSIDYPGKLAAVFFLQGCAWTCEYCHNRSLQPMKTSGKFSYVQSMNWLKTRIGLLDAVVISGGEPLMQASLPEAILEIKSMGYEVGLHTAGIRPNQLKKIESSLDWIGFDLKHIPQKIESITQRAKGDECTFEALEIISKRTKPYEIRTTIHSRWHSSADLIEIAHLLKDYGIKKWALQSFRQEGTEMTLLPENSKKVYASIIPVCEELGLELEWR